MPNNSGGYTRERLILCEGKVDVGFITRLVKENGLKPAHIRHSGNRRTDRGGISRFGQTLEAAKVNASFRAAIRDILIVADSDDDPAAAFTRVARQVARAGFTPPVQVRQWSVGNPRTAIFILPPDQTGALESYAQPAARALDPNLSAHVDQFVAACAPNWPGPKADKLWLRSFLSVRNEPDPCASTFSILCNREPEPINFSHASMNGLIAFLGT